MPYKINPFTGNPDYYDASSGGTVTSVASGTGLTGGPITTTGTLSVDSATVPYYAGGPGSAGFVKWNGTAWAIDTASYVNRAGDTMTGSLILNADPTTALGAATKQYVDNIATGINFHAPVRAATTGPLPAVTYNNTPDPLNPGVGATLIATSPGALTIDTVTFSGGGTERVLIKNQVSGVENGIYVVNIAGNAITPFQLTRATDADNSPTGELAFGDFCFVEQGPTNGGFGYILNTTGTITVGVTALSYVIFNAAQVVTAGTGLTELPTNTLNININKVPYYSGGFSGGFAKWDGSNWIFDNSTYLDTTTAASTYLTIANAITTYYPLSSNPAGYITSGSLSGYVPYTGATNNVNLGAFQLTAAGVNISGLTTGSVLFAGASGALSQDNTNFFWDDSNNRLGIGNNTPTEALTVTGNMLLNLTGSTSVKIYNVTGINTYESAGPTLISSTGGNYINIKASGDFAIQTNGSGVNKLVISTSNSLGNTTTQFNSTLFAQGNVLASTEVRSVLFSGNTKTWQTGNITTQRWFHITANTAAFAGASVITNNYSLYVDATTVGSNATITNNYAAGFEGNVIIRDSLPISTLLNADLEVHKYANRDIVAVVRNDWQGVSNIASASVIARSDSSTQLKMSMTSNNYATVGLIIAGTGQLTTGGSLANRLLIGHSTSSKDIIFVNGGTAAANEIFRISSTNTIDIYEARNFTFGTTTGTKFGTSTSQKLGFFNATPIVQPASVTTAQGLADRLTDLGLIASGSVIPSGGSSTPNVQTVVSAATVTPTFVNDEVIITAQAVNLTLANPTGTAAEGKSLIIRIKDNGTTRGITFDTQYRAINVVLPTSTTASRTLYLSMIYNATDTKWDVTGVGLENANPDNTVQLLYYSNNC